MNMEEYGSIRKFFEGKNIFITGGSGFLGKPLIEKLLRSCPDIENIYVLLRTKRGKDVQERLEQILLNPIFNLLKKTNPNNIKKIICVNGDSSKPGLGLSDEDKQILINKINIFYHGAASVKFDDFLKDGIVTNIGGAQEAAKLALEMKNIEVFMHISTSYCNINNRKIVEEVLYPADGSWRDALFWANNCDFDMLNVLSQKLLGTFPNNYTYAKQLAEHCINDLLVGKVPTVICRPSIVVGSIMEPFPGWIDNFNGPMGLLVGGGTGLIRTLYADTNLETEYVPVDNVVKLLIVSTWNKGISRDANSLSIYHGSKYNHPQFYVGAYIDIGRELCWEDPFESKIWHPDGAPTTNWLYYFVNVLLFHMVPAFFLDILLRMTGYKPRLFKIQRKVYIANMAIKHFSLNEWHFVNDEACKLLKKIPSKEMKYFNFDIMPADYRSLKEFYRQCTIYVKVHFLKENRSVTKRNSIITKMMFVMHKSIKTTCYIILIWSLFFKINILELMSRLLLSYWNGLI